MIRLIDIKSPDEPLLLCGDCMELLKEIPDKSIDMVFCDLPFGTTQNEWDKTLPLEDYIICDSFRFNKAEYLLYAYRTGISYKKANAFWKKNKVLGLWSHYRRIIKDRGCIALFCQTPFDVTLCSSNSKMLKYEWIIEKTKATGHLNSGKMPMKAHEKILMFYKKVPTFHPQMTEGHPPVHSFVKRTGDGNCYGATKEVSGGGSTKRFPRDVLKFKWDTQTSHLNETQKPIKLLEYFVKTYTNPGDIVLDNCMGSGGTGVVCRNNGRKFIGMELRPMQFEIARARILEGNVESGGVKNES